ncbi:MAG: hypothetical protein KFB93_05915 [Simkaniaceae bacterium]|nr:MAG: hypothetical protein KFB93_05915 [Simkaniaceae bacterium]
MNDDFSFSAQSFKYWEIFLSWLFKYPTRCYELKKERGTQVYENPSEIFNRFGKSYRERYASKGIICRVTPSYKDIEQAGGVLRQIYEHVENPRLCEWAIFEVMAKVMAYRNLKQGHTIPLPIMGSDGCMMMTTHVVDRVFDLWNKIRAFGLVRSDGGGAPILLFRGTDFSFMTEGGRASIISDLDPKGPGWTLFEKGQKPIHEWLKKENRAARVIGHSLGGVVAAYTLIHEAEWMSQESYESSYAFNFPGVPEALTFQWDALEEKPAFRGFVCRGDLISKLGMLFGDIFEVSLEKPLSPVRAHEILLFAESRGYLNEVDLEGENHSKSREFYSKLQQQTSSVIYDFGLKFLFPN